MTRNKTDKVSDRLKKSHYGFSATRIENLEASEYTLAAIAADVSGSVAAFEKEIEAAIVHIATACRCSPRANNLMLRVLQFDHQVREVHGFIPLRECKKARYDGCLQTGGTTALYDAAINAIDSVTRYGRELGQHAFSVNGILFVITDGLDNASRLKADDVKGALARAVGEESLETTVAILVGVNVQDASVGQSLHDFHLAAGFDRYIEIRHATASELANLADFVTRSISAQSLALGTGKAGPQLTF